MKSLVIGDQEFEGNHDFSKASVVITTDLQEVLGDSATSIVQAAISLVMATYGEKADRLQAFSWSDGVTEKQFWLVLDDYGSRNVVTALLPEEY